LRRIVFQLHFYECMDQVRRPGIEFIPQFGKAMDGWNEG
jgi:hypothetical protein